MQINITFLWKTYTFLQLKSKFEGELAGLSESQQKE